MAFKNICQDQSRRNIKRQCLSRYFNAKKKNAILAGIAKSWKGATEVGTRATKLFKKMESGTGVVIYEMRVI